MAPRETPNREFLSSILDHVADGIYFVDRERRVTYWNRAAERLTGFPATSILGHSCGDNRLVHCDESGHVLCKAGCPLTAVFYGKEVATQEVFVLCRNGSRRPVIVTATPVRDEAGVIIGAVEIFRDNRAKLQAEEQAERSLRLACVDALTGIANRRQVERIATGYLAEGFVEEAPGVLLMLDVDHFKRVNDTYGHDAGDAVLKTVAGTLAGCVRDGDLVGRWGGEEFVVLLPAALPKTGEKIAERLRAQVAQSVSRCGEHEVVVTCSIGGTVVGRGEELATVVRRADTCMYAAKHSGRNRVCFEEAGGSRNVARRRPSPLVVLAGGLAATEKRPA